MRVEIRSLSALPITSQQQLSELLLARVPEGFRANFLQPPHPAKLSVEDWGIDQAQLAKAIQIISQAIETQQQVLIFGDYDCDGVTATAVLWEALHRRGLSAQPFLPHREKHGYGLSQTALEEVFARQKPDLVITVDNGIVAQAEVEWLKQQGVKVIVTDHHEVHGELPPADAVVHTTLVAGVGVAWLLAKELLGEEGNELLDLVVLGTIADQVPLVGANRSLASHGLRALRQTTRPSLLTLAEIAGTDLKQASVNTINYSLAPRINAMGRLASAMDALRALVTRNPHKTRQLMSQLDTTNTQRQTITQNAIEDVHRSLLTSKDDLVVLAAGEYHEGVIGLIASKLVDLHHKPSIVISTQGDTYKASCRSIPGVHITELLRELPPEVFTSLGGHAMAAGFSLKRENLAKFPALLLQKAKKRIEPDLLVPHLEVLGQLDWSLLNLETVTTLNTFAPYGAGYTEPLFMIDNLEVVDQKTVGKTQNHLKLQLRQKDNGFSTSAICFQYEKKLPQTDSFSQIAIRLKASTYHRGGVDVEVVAAA